MMERFGRFAFAVIAPLFLFGCILTPGKFVSSLTINKDRTFTFLYKGEVIAIDPSSEFTKGMSKGLEEKASGQKDADENSVDTTSSKSTDKNDDAAENKRRQMAEALSKEAGYKSVVYLGKGKYLIDYAISGTLSHSFVYPYNTDAEAIVPFIALEVRQGNIVRVRAPGFAGESNSKTGGASSSSEASKFLDGEFTLDTDAEIISQNNENGAPKVGGRNIIKWRATPLTKDAPNATLRFAK